MKKILSSLIAGIVFSAGLSALTWSGLFNTELKCYTPNKFNSGTINQSDSLYFSMRQSFNQTGNLFFAAEGMYKFNLDKTTDVDAKITNILDVTLLKFSGTWSTPAGNIDFIAGRYKYSDISRIIFSQTNDGLYIGLENQLIKASVYSGYTGLLNSLNVSMTAAPEGNNTQIYNLCKGLIPVSADFTLKTSVLSPAVQLMYFIDPQGNMKNTAYGTVSLNGLVSRFGSYEASLTVGTNDFEAFMLYGKFGFNLYAVRNWIFHAGMNYFSRAQDSLAGFTTITAYAPYHGGVLSDSTSCIIPNLSVGFVMQKLYANVELAPVFTEYEDGSTFLGTDVTISAVFNVLSDVKFGVEAGAFINQASDTDIDYYSISINGTIVF